MKPQIVKPGDIEAKSMEILSEILNEMGKTLPEAHAHIIKRCIHTSADFEYADSLYFSENVVEIIANAIKNGAVIVSDTNMARAGINKKAITGFGGEVRCFIAEEDVAKEAIARGVTRATVSMERAAALGKPVVLAIGNAPTALLELVRLQEEGKFSPVAVIGVPVGFVNVVESKELLMQSGIPCIVARGRKGGSNIAAAICNSILYENLDGR